MKIYYLLILFFSFSFLLLSNTICKKHFLDLNKDYTSGNIIKGVKFKNIKNAHEKGSLSYFYSQNLFVYKEVEYVPHEIIGIAENTTKRFVVIDVTTGDQKFDLDSFEQELSKNPLIINNGGTLGIKSFKLTNDGKYFVFNVLNREMNNLYYVWDLENNKLKILVNTKAIEPIPLYFDLNTDSTHLIIGSRNSKNQDNIDYTAWNIKDGSSISFQSDLAMEMDFKDNKFFLSLKKWKNKIEFNNKVHDLKKNKSFVAFDGEVLAKTQDLTKFLVDLTNGNEIVFVNNKKKHEGLLPDLRIVELVEDKKGNLTKKIKKLPSMEEVIKKIKNLYSDNVSINALKETSFSKDGRFLKVNIELRTEREVDNYIYQFDQNLVLLWDLENSKLKTIFSNQLDTVDDLESHRNSNLNDYIKSAWSRNFITKFTENNELIVARGQIKKSEEKNLWDINLKILEIDPFLNSKKVQITIPSQRLDFELAPKDNFYGIVKIDINNKGSILIINLTGEAGAAVFNLKK